KIHPHAGYEILDGIEFPWPIARIVQQHHEHIDGSGYPLGLQREEILLEAQILTVADVVEATSSYRPYRPANGITVALAEITTYRGDRYSPIVVDACLGLFNKGFMLK
ncbi:MAG: HD domain-containing protein, partial [Desulfuromonadaceae bacterium]|nr:HD domain-containing protein [Desulfuromonadaceae bacterium]